MGCCSRAACEPRKKLQTLSCKRALMQGDGGRREEESGGSGASALRRQAILTRMQRQTIIHQETST